MVIKVVQDKSEFANDWEAKDGKLSVYKPEEIGFASSYLFAAIQITYLEDDKILKFRFSIEPQECRDLADQLLSLASDVEGIISPGTA